jgi:hypothetical protein
MSFALKPPYSPKNNWKYPPREKGKRFCILIAKYIGLQKNIIFLSQVLKYVN